MPDTVDSAIPSNSAIRGAGEPQTTQRGDRLDSALVGAVGHAFAWALARHIQHRNGPHRAKRIRLLEARHQIAA